MEHNKFCRFANDTRDIKFKKVCFDCQRLEKARAETLTDVMRYLDATQDINYNVHELRAFIKGQLA